jgi:hypothetical protein
MRTIKSLIIFTMLCLPVVAVAGPREQAVVLHKRLTGVMPSPTTLDQMAALIQAGQAKDAARIATQSRYFYELTVKQWALPLSNVDQTAVVPLNDTASTIIGIVKDNIAFTNVLTGDILYTADGATGVRVYGPQGGAARNHFQDIENILQAQQDLPLRDVLMQKTQSSTNGFADPAGIITSQSYGEAWFQAGTNRRVFQSLVRNFWCQEMEQIHDTSIPGIRIRQDVTRVPGGSTALFQNKCAGCHGTMDAAIGGTAYMDYSDNNGLTLGTTVVGKMTRNSNEYVDGFRTTDDSWLWLGDYSSTGSFNKFGWRGAKAGNGISSLADAWSVSRGFSECMSKRVFKKVCVRDATSLDEPTVQMLADSFEAKGRYNMRELFEDTAVLCMGE